MQLLVLFGKPGVGKYTVGKELSKKLGFRFFHNHLMFNLLCALFPFGSEPFRRLREEIWLRTLTEAAMSSGLGIVFTFVPEETISDAFLPTLMRDLEKRGVRIRLVQIVCAPEEHERRLTSEGRAAMGKLTSFEEYLSCEREGFYDSPSISAPDFVIDITGLRAEVAAEEIARRIFQ